jgi:hypothetical protein
VRAAGPGDDVRELDADMFDQEEAEAQREGEVVRDEGMILRASMFTLFISTMLGCNVLSPVRRSVRSARSRPAVLRGRVIGPHLSFH